MVEIYSVAVFLLRIFLFLSAFIIVAACSAFFAINLGGARSLVSGGR